VTVDTSDCSLRRDVQVAGADVISSGTFSRCSTRPAAEPGATRPRTTPWTAIRNASFGGHITPPMYQPAEHDSCRRNYMIHDAIGIRCDCVHGSFGRCCLCCGLVRTWRLLRLSCVVYVRPDRNGRSSRVIGDMRVQLNRPVSPGARTSMGVAVVMDTVHGAAHPSRHPIWPGALRRIARATTPSGVRRAAAESPPPARTPIDPSGGDLRLWQWLDGGGILRK
jgi:hypothetical protein